MINADSFCELLYICKSSPNHLELLSLKSRVTNSEYDELTVKTRTKSSSTSEGVVAIALAKNFYQSHEWKAVRYQALRVYKNYCHCCGAKAGENVQLQVDHIKPRSLSPELAIDVSNLQILCSECNQGKSNLDSTDWR